MKRHTQARQGRSCLISVFAIAICAIVFCTDAASAGKEPRNSTQLRFRFCAGAGDGCTQPGRGYTVCERFLQMLNALPSNEPPPVCEIKLPPSITDFALPMWEDMPIAENMRLIYDMEMFLVPPAKGAVPPEWEQYFTDESWRKFSPENPLTWRRVPYEVWLDHYQARMQKGEMAPRLRRTRAALNENGPETLVAYDRFPGGDLGQCRRDLATSGSSGGGSHVFLMVPNMQQPVQALGGVRLGRHIVLMHHGKAYLVFTDINPDEDWFLSLNIAMPPLPAHLEQDPHRYVMTQRCAFKLNKKP